MNMNSKIHQLKNGKSIFIRTPQLSEAEKLINLKRNYINGTTTIPLVLTEYPSSVDTEIQLIEDYQNSNNSILLIAEFEGEFIGNIDITGSKRSKLSHTAMLGMGIKETWRNQGLGTLLIESAIHWVKTNSKIELIWLDVYASNKIGCRAYQKTGFKISGVVEGFFKEKNEYIDKVQMYQRITR